MDTIAEAKQFLREHWRQPGGTDCPCCAQNVKLYERQIYKTVAEQLIALYRLNQAKPGFYHVSKIKEYDKSNNPIGGDFAKLRYWGLIFAEPKNDNPEKRSSGKWHITEKGIDFVEQRITIPKFCFTYNKKPLKLGGDPVSILDCLANDRFRYNELMGYPV